MFTDVLCKRSLLGAGLSILVALFVGKSVLAGASTLMPSLKLQTAFAVPLPSRKPDVSEDETFKVAMAMPEDLSFSSKFFGLSSQSILSNRQARIYREIFILQDIGDIKSANSKINRLNSSVLLGHVLAERYLHPTAYKASFKELEQWLSLYADHPQAARIYKLALVKKPLSYAKKNLAVPKSAKKIGGNLVAQAKQGKTYRTAKKRSVAENSRVRKLQADIRKNAEHRQPTLALNALSNDYAVQFMDDVEYDTLRATIAAGYLHAGKIDKAVKVSGEALARSGAYVPLAGWVGGLAYWQKQDYKKSAQAFETAASSPYSSGWMVSAAAYWAARANKEDGQDKLVDKWLELSATYPRTFYGLIAMRALGHDVEFDWDVPGLTRDHIKFIEGTEQGKRAAALIKVERIHLAEEELRKLPVGRSVQKREALMAYANHYQLPALSMQLGNAFTNKSGGLYDAALYPITGWEPQSGYRVDRALIHAIVRQESRFRTNAANPSGATGLMQLMPATARYVAGDTLSNDKSDYQKLLSPALNLEIGQRYVEKLLSHREVGQDLLSLAVAYNAGPGNLSRWKSERADMDDPLLFIETIPYNETRAFVERVMSNYWIYRMRLGQDTPSLDAVVDGKWARYTPQDKGNAKFALAD